ncbi:type II toxin-antitoxin system VapC family toxin [uncultured Mucilaginibacter sp.]|uniref:type II toxin-antitoxin system VapC family toxin n=1 Tax=uncultured Mucilaginibacter sp. TaxID=797541 RepID=UPI0025FE3CE3|nr:type II toxin-antitoxin system VapC family toxin [uncultured Mucilaginibacter sp.]
MTGSSCLLDTSIIIHSFKDTSIKKRFDSFAEIFVPSIVAGELYFGVYRSANPIKRLAEMQAFLVNCTLLTVDAETGNCYGKIKTDLYAKGKPIPENDIWIAAVSIQHDLPLFTADKHFKEVQGIALV